MTVLEDFIRSFAYEIIFTIVFSSGIMAIFLSKIRNGINLKAVGINYIHKKGKDVKNMQKAIKTSRQIKIISFMPFSFVFDYKDMLVERIKDGCDIKMLVCNKESSLLKDICKIERNTYDDIANQFQPLINLITSIKSDAGDDSTGAIEVRTYNTEIRNPAIICVDKEENILAFLTISLPPKRSIDNIMLEFKGTQGEDIINYFDKIWERHTNDIALRIK